MVDTSGQQYLAFFSILKFAKYAIIAGLLLPIGSRAKIAPTHSMEHKYLSIAAIMSFKYVQDTKFHICAHNLFNKMRLEQTASTILMKYY